MGDDTLASRVVDPASYPQWEPAFRWRRNRLSGQYSYSCSPELRRASVQVYYTGKGWVFDTKYGGIRGRTMTASYICKCCGTKIARSVALGWRTHTEAQRAAEIFIAKDE